MTKTKTTLIDLKLAVINYHSGKEFEYLRNSIARDACYTSFNSMQYKANMMSDVQAELRGLAEEHEGSEVVHVNVERKVALYHGMEAELAELSERHEADLKAYKTVTGDTWTARPRKQNKPTIQTSDAELARILAL